MDNARVSCKVTAKTTTYPQANSNRYSRSIATAKNRGKHKQRWRETNNLFLSATNSWFNCRLCVGFIFMPTFDAVF
ncbi:hypothetical protein KM043_009469 [Ampulex compressa]|nr:hypothetical protein KM043_009469 [Ampulex compressa]